MNKGMMKAIGTMFFVALAIGIVIGIGFLLYNAPVGYGQTINASTNNISINFTLNNSIGNNTMFFTNRPLNVTVVVANSSNPTTIQFATVWVKNTTGELVGFNLTNDTVRQNTSHMVFYNATPIIFGSYYDSVNVRGGDRNITVSIYNVSGPGYEWLNESGAHMPFNVTVNEYAPNKTNITFAKPVYSTTNSTELFSKDLNVTIQTNVSVTTATFYEWNDRSAELVPAISGNNTHFWNKTQFQFLPAFNGTGGFFRNTTVKVCDAYNNCTWYNATQGQAGVKLIFQVNEKKINLTDIVPHGDSIQNATVYGGNRSLNVTVNTTLSYVIAYVNRTVGQNLTQYSSNLKFGNTSAFLFSDNTFVNKLHNVTWSACDAFGNCTWLNLTDSLTYFTIDGTAPTVTIEKYTIGNKSTGGNYLNVTINVTDGFANGCGVRLIYENASVINVSAETTINTSANMPFCFMNITPSMVNFDGLAYVQAFGVDTANNKGYVDRNGSFTFSRLKTGWNVLASSENKTMTQIAQETTNITYVSEFYNDINNKTFGTFTVGGTSNSGLTIRIGNVSFVYVNANVLLVRNFTNNTIPYNVTLVTNTSTKNGWNAIGFVSFNATNRTLNNTLGMAGCTNTTLGDLPVNCANFTWIGYYDPTLGSWCAGQRGLSALSCGSGKTMRNTTIPLGFGAMIWNRDNTTLNLTRYPDRT